MSVQRVVRVVATALTVVVVLGTGIAWSNVRSFEDGIFHMSAPSLGKGGDDGAIDILLVGLDSRTDAHGNPLSAEELATLRAGDEEATNTDTIILVRIPNNGKSATAISIPRDSYVAAPGLGKTKINGVYGQTREGVHDKWLRLHREARQGSVSTKVQAPGEFVTYWLEKFIRPNRTPATYANYEMFARLRIIPGSATSGWIASGSVTCKRGSTRGRGPASAARKARTPGGRRNFVAAVRWGGAAGRFPRHAACGTCGTASGRRSRRQ